MAIDHSKLMAMHKKAANIRKKYADNDDIHESALPEKTTEEWLASQLKVSPNEVDAYIRETEAQFEEKNISDLLSECRQQTIQSIINPLGLGKFIALYDKIGWQIQQLRDCLRIWSTRIY